MNNMKSSFMSMYQQDNQQVTPQVIAKENIDTLNQTAEAKSKLQLQEVSNMKMRSAI